MIDYRSDNTGRAAPQILEALVQANTGTALGYGADEWTARLQERFSELFETRVRVFPVATGTAANALSLAAISPSWGLVYCSEVAHINTAEANAAVAAQVIDENASANVARRDEVWRRRKWLRFACARNQN